MKNFFKFILFLILLAGLIFLYGSYLEPNLIISHEHNIKVDNLTNNFDGFTIVHLSDIKYTKDSLDNLKRLVKKVNEYNPDIVVLTGDLFKKGTNISTDDISNITDELNKIKASEGMYIISGDEDQNFDEWKNVVNMTNFINLDNTYDTIYKNGYDYIFISGVSSDKGDINNDLKTSKDYLDKTKNKPIYKILLMHEPDKIDELNDNDYNLVLAGHYMGNNIDIPIIKDFFTKDGFKKYHDSYYKINNTDLYLSNGIGNDDLNFRLLNVPSFNVYRLVKD